MSIKSPPPSPKQPPRAPWRVDDAQVAAGVAIPPPPDARSALVSPPIAPPPPPPAASADSPPGDAAARIRAAASKGGSLKALHTLFSVSSDTFKQWLDADPSLRQAFDEGKELEREALHRTLYEAAIYKRDLNAAQFLLKTRHQGYREAEAEDSRNRVNVTFVIPAAAPNIKTYVEVNDKLAAVPLPRPPRVIEHE